MHVVNIVKLLYFIIEFSYYVAFSFIVTLEAYRFCMNFCGYNQSYNIVLSFVLYRSQIK